jgi:hypothetical protein
MGQANTKQRQGFHQPEHDGDRQCQRRCLALRVTRALCSVMSLLRRLHTHNPSISQRQIHCNCSSNISSNHLSISSSIAAPLAVS